MAITPWQAGGILNPQEYFGKEEYGKLSPKITTPSLLRSGVLGDVAGKGPRTQRGLKCPTGTQPNASNTACVPIQKAGTCPAGTTGVWPNCTPTKIGGGTCPDGTTGVWPNCKPIIGDGKTCPDGTTGVWPNCKPSGPTTTTTSQDGCPQGWSRDQWGNCHPTPLTTSEEAKNLFDQRWEGKGPANIFTVAPPRVDPRTGQTISDTGISMADAAKNYGLTPEESYRVTYSPYGAEERGQGAARGTWETPQQGLNTSMMSGVDYGAALAQQPALLSAEDFLSKYSEPSPYSILSPEGEIEAIRSAQEKIERDRAQAVAFEEPPSRQTQNIFMQAREFAEEPSEEVQELRKAVTKTDVDAKKAEKKATTAKKTASKAKAKAKSNPTPLNQKAAFMAQSNAQKATQVAVSKRNTAKEKKTESIMGATNYAAYTRRGRK